MIGVVSELHISIQALFIYILLSGTTGMEKRDKMKRKHTLINLVLFTSIILQLMVLPVAAEEYYEEMSTKDMLYVRGLISNVYPDTMQISVKPPKGELVRISIDPDTILEGVSDFGEFKKEQQVKVWYKLDNDSNRAVKINKMMELGC